MLNRSKSLAVSLLAATFLLGVAVGGVALAAWGDRGDAPERPPRERQSYSDILERELSLTTAQRESVDVILTRRQQAMTDMWAEIGPRFDSLRAQIRVEIAQVLDEEQQGKYQDMITRSERYRGGRERGNHGK
ncbi:MAG: periplasmic heavy metal sensor [Gemmatimonadota bacterium]|nr:periplasmic heavy metal sensor [Gemmatimonadota bacterium]MDH3368600.1 periplasmic heavy metal sensor [Gemmatimonadota bacterium]MDH3478413.1 periplasmic heavy metal sensor [Gemmatimonadota bacterium]MDH3568766.1 periplasmic heavy metal sensor [Gemmatimonadota bacterium]MDH5549375.1 periplasmic heavy metal sensor [Gemmatimonadota bacterium]